MKMYEMRKDGVFGIGFIDPNFIHEVTVKHNTEFAEKLLLKSLGELHAQEYIYYFLTTSSECHYFVQQIIVLLT